MWHIYVEEPHPGERGFKKYSQHANYGHRLDYAKELRRLLGIENPILLDGMDGRIHRQYGTMPSMTYLVDKSGRVVYKANWTDAGAIDPILGRLAFEEAQ